MNSTFESDDDDSELLQTLSQLHNVINRSQSFEENNPDQSDLSFYSLGINHKQVLSSDRRKARENKGELLNEKKQHRHSRIAVSSSDIETRKIADKEQKEKAEKKTVIFHRNHNDDDDDVRNDKQKENKYHRRNDDDERQEEKSSTTLFFAFTSTTASPTLFNSDESQLTVDPDTYSSLPNLRLVSSLSNAPIDDSTRFTNQSMTDDSQITKTNANMTDNFTNQTTSDLFDPFAPNTNTLSGLFDDMFRNSNTTDDKDFGVLADFLPSNTTTTAARPLPNYDFDDLWNQSISHLTSSNDHENRSTPNFDPNAFAWDTFLTNNHKETTNPFDDRAAIVPTSTLTWESLFDHEETEDENDLYNYLQWLFDHFDDSSVVDQSESTIRSPSISNLQTIINDIQMSVKSIPSPSVHLHLVPTEIFEIPDHSSSFDIQVKPIVEQLVSLTIQSALNEVNYTSEHVEHFVDQILSQAIFEVYSDDQTNANDNLTSSLHWHQQPLDSVRNDQSDVPKHAGLDPWLTTSEDKNADSMTFFSRTSDDSDLFSSENNRTNEHPEREDEETSNLSEYLPPSLITNPFNATRIANNAMKYTLTAPVMDDSGDDSSFLEDYLTSHKNEPIPPLTTQQINESTEQKDSRTDDDDPPDNIFTADSRLSNFEVFASDQPLAAPEVDGNFASTIGRSLSMEDNSPWTSIVQSTTTVKSSGIGDDEPWELEDSSENKLPMLKTTPRFANVFSDMEFTATDKFDTHSNFFSDTFNPPVIEEQNANITSPTNISNVGRSPIDGLITQQDDDLDKSSTTTSDSEEIEMKPTVTDHWSAPIERKRSENEIIAEHPVESMTLTASEITADDLPPALPSLTNKSNFSMENIPLKSTSTTDSKEKLDFRSESNLTTSDAKIHSSTDTPLARATDSAILRSTSKDDIVKENDEDNDVISCVIDKISITIDAKTIAPFKCVISSAGRFHEDNRTAVIALYGCSLPDHRLREYRYIMDQLFYYVYHKLEELVTDDYILIYFHGATPKHRTPDLKFLRKCYQMINFRLRKNLRAVYVVHPTRWLRTVIALSRPFFSKKFYHKINYLYTIAELERQFPHNHLAIPLTIEQTDWLYSQKYDRNNASIKRSIAQSMSQSVGGHEGESVA